MVLLRIHLNFCKNFAILVINHIDKSFYGLRFTVKSPKIFSHTVSRLDLPTLVSYETGNPFWSMKL